MTLTPDQRWLLMHMGGWEIVGALCSPEGVAHLMQSCWGATCGRGGATDIPGCPDWVRHAGWDIAGGTITARAQGGPHVKIKAAQINAYAKTLPADIKAELIACRDAGTANAVLGHRLCRQKRRHEHLPYEDRICPATQEQLDAQAAEYWRVVDWQPVVLSRALGLNGQSHIEGDQLDLFGASA